MTTIAGQGPTNGVRRPKPRPRKSSSSTNGATIDDHGGVREKRRSAARVPRVGHEALLVARVEELAQRARCGDDHDQRDERAPGGPPASRGNLEREQAPVEAVRDAEDQDEHDPVLDERSDDRRPEVEQVVGRLAAGETAGVGRGRQEADEDAPGDEPPRLPPRRSRRGVDHAVAQHARSRHATQYHRAHLTTYTQSHAPRIVAVSELRHVGSAPAWPGP